MTTTIADYIAHQLDALCPKTTFAVMPGEKIICLAPDQTTLQTLQALAQENVITGELVTNDDQIMLDPKKIDIGKLHDFQGKEESRKEKLAAAVRSLNHCIEAASGHDFYFDGHVLSAKIAQDEPQSDMNAILSFLEQKGAIGNFWADDKRMFIYRADPQALHYNSLRISNASFLQMLEVLGRHSERLLTVGL